MSRTWQVVGLPTSKPDTDNGGDASSDARNAATSADDNGDVVTLIVLWWARTFVRARPENDRRIGSPHCAI